MRPIDADALKADLHFVVGNNKSNKIDVREVIERIDLMRTLDVKPVVHAHWIEFRANSGNVHYKCSHCGKEVSYPYAKKKWKYCIECGAKMDEEKNTNGEDKKAE